MAMELTKDQLAKLVKEVDTVAAVFPNYTVSLPSFGEADTLTDNKTSSWGIDTIGAMSVWGAYGKRGRGTTIAVLDTRIDSDHPDLTGKISAFAEFDPNGAIVPGAVVSPDYA